MNSLWLPFLSATVFALIATPFVRRMALRKGILDIPKDGRRVHKKPIPLAGGLAIFFSFLLGVFLYVPLSKEVMALILGSLLIVISGFIDDTKGLSPKGKLAFQGIAAIILLLGDVKIEFFTNPLIEYDLINLRWLVFPITVFWVVGITNTINLIDGLDGLAAGVSMICAISFMFIAGRFGFYQVAVISAVLGGACLGFLAFNFNPASIFMGDTGALFLGFVLAYISIEGVMKSAAIIALILPVLILGVPIFDTTFAMLRRKLSGRAIMSADKGHLHHRLLARGLSQRETVITLYLISGLFGVAANVAGRFSSSRGLIFALVLVGIVVVLAIMGGMLHHKEDPS